MTSAPTSRLPAPTSDGTAGLTSAEVASVADDDAHSPDTRRAYSSQWRQWTTWADERGFPAFDGVPGGADGPPGTRRCGDGRPGPPSTFSLGAPARWGGEFGDVRAGTDVPLVRRRNPLPRWA